MAYPFLQERDVAFLPNNDHQLAMYAASSGLKAFSSGIVEPQLGLVKINHANCAFPADIDQQRMVGTFLAPPDYRAAYTYWSINAYIDSVVHNDNISFRFIIGQANGTDLDPTDPPSLTNSVTIAGDTGECHVHETVAWRSKDDTLQHRSLFFGWIASSAVAATSNVNGYISVQKLSAQPPYTADRRFR